MFGQRLKYKDACKRFNLTPRELVKIIQDYGVKSHFGNGITEEYALHAAINLKPAKRLFLQYGEGWYKRFRLTDPFDNVLLARWGAENFDKENYEPLQISDKIREELAEIANSYKLISEVPAAAPQNSKKKKELEQITKSQFPEATVRVYCKDCRTERKAVGDCPHPVERKKYNARFYIPGAPDLPPIVRGLQSRYFGDAIVELRGMLAALKESNYNTTELSEVKSDHKITLLSEAIEEFKKYKRNNNDKIVVVEGNTEKYIAGIEKALDLLSSKLEELGYKYFPLTYFSRNDIFRKLYDNMRSYTVTKEDIELKRVKAGKKEGERLYGDVTLNGYTNTWRMLCKWLNEVKNVPVANPFREASIPVAHDPQAMSDEEFEELIAWMATKPNLTTEQARRVSPSDLDWLRVAFLIQARYDVRLEDVVLAKWTDIQFEERRGLYILRTTNHKVTRKKKAGVVYRYAPVEREIVEAIGEEMFIRKAGVVDDYILLDAEAQALRVDRGGKRVRPVGRDRVRRKISQGFGELCRVMFGKEFALTNKSLRKLKMTDNSARFEDAWKMSHGSSKVFTDHYEDKRKKALKQSDKNENVYRVGQKD